MSPEPEGRSALRRLGEPTLAFLLQLLLLDAAVETVISGSPVRWWVAGAVGLYLGGDALLWWKRPEWSRSVRWTNRATVSFFVLLGLLAFTVWLPGGLRDGMVLLGQGTSVLLCGVAAAAVALTGASLLRIDALGAPGRAAVAAVAIYAVVAFVWAIPAEVPYPELFQGESAWSRLPFWLQGAFLGGVVLLPVALILTLVERFIPIFGDERRRYAAPLPLLHWAERLIRHRARHPHSLAFRSVALTMSLAMAVAGLVEPLMPSGDSRAFDRDPDASTAFDRDAPAGSNRNAPAGFDRDGEESGAAAEESPWATAELRSPESLEHRADELERALAALETAAGEIPRTTFDLQAVIEQVGRDPARLFRWVRDSTYLGPYRGVLRGATGVLLDRVGNSLDRALLLLLLLHEAEHRSLRLAHAELSDEKAQTLLENARPIPPGGPLPFGESSSDETLQSLLDIAEQHSLETAELSRIMREAEARTERLAEDTERRTTEQSEAITQLLRANDLPPEPERQTARLRADALQALKRHWWVQWHDGGQWVDLDPSFPDARLGAPVVAAESIVPADELDKHLADERHVFEIRIVIERWINGRLVEAPVLSHELFPAAFLGEQVSLHHAPMNWPRDVSLLTTERPLEALREAVLAQREWVPVLTVGTTTVARYSFTASGRINDPALPGFAQNVLAGRALAEGLEGGIISLGEGIFDMVTGGPPRYAGGPSRDAPLTDRIQTSQPAGTAELTAEWVEYEIRAPGEESTLVRRQVFDLLGPAARAAGQEAGEPGRIPPPELTESDRLSRGFALLGQTNVLPLVSELPDDYVGHLQVQSILDNGRVIKDLFCRNTSRPEDLEELTDRAAGVKPFPGHLYGLALARLLWSPQPADRYLSRINILASHQYLSSDSPGELTYSKAVDIVANETTPVLGAESDPFEVRLRQGVLDTNAEASLLPEGGIPDNTAELFARSVAEGSRWHVVQREDDPLLVAPAVPQGARSRMRKELENGYVVLAPAAAVQFGDLQQFAYWRLDPATGDILGIGDRGWGQTTVEKMLLVSVAVFAGVFYACLLMETLEADKWIPRDVPREDIFASGQLAFCACQGGIAGASSGVGVLSGGWGVGVGTGIGGYILGGSICPTPRYRRPPGRTP